VVEAKEVEETAVDEREVEEKAVKNVV